MFSHVMVGSNDIDRSKNSMTRCSARQRTRTTRAGSPIAQRRSVHGHQADRWRAGDHANGGTIGFNFDSPEEVDAWHSAGVEAGGTSIEDPPGYRESAFGKLYLAYLRDPDGNKLCGLHRPAAVSVEIVSENKSHGGRQLVVRHASAATSHRHDLLDLPAAAGRRRRKAAGRLVSVGPYLHPCQCHRERRISRRLRRARPDLRRAGHQPARRGCARRRRL